MNPVPPGYHAPFEVLTKNDHTARIEILAALGLVISIVFLGFRMFSRRGKFASDDRTLFVATAVGVIQSGVTIVACRTGLGKRSILLNEMTQHSVQQITYASTLLLILTVGLSRLSFVLFLYNLTEGRSRKRVLSASIAIVAALTLTSLLVFALQCELKRPWITYGKSCKNLTSRWHIILSFDIVLEVVSTGVTTYLISSLQEERAERKLKAIVLLSMHIVTIIPIALQFTRLHKRSFTADPTSDAEFFMWSQIAMHVSLITTTCPLLLPMFDDFKTYYGCIGRMGLSGTNKSANSFPMASLPNAEETEEENVTAGRRSSDSGRILIERKFQIRLKERAM